MGSRLRIAVVGSGAAGMATLMALLDSERDAEVTLIDVGRSLNVPPAPETEPSLHDAYDQLYAGLRRDFPRAFPPPKTHLGAEIPKREIIGGGQVYISDTLGGLTNYWGGTMLPFTDRELARWPVAAADLAPAYRRIAAVVGIASADDRLSDYFGSEYHTRPPIRCTALCRRLEALVNGSAGSHGFAILAGANRCALETRADQPSACVYCGECMAGCLRGSIYSAATTVRSFLTDPRVRLHRGRIRRIADGRCLVLGERADEEEIGPFDRIFLAAGCVASTEIVLRTLGTQREVPIHDNAVFVFPILYRGLLDDLSGDVQLGMTNTIIGCVPDAADVPFAQVQVYPSFSYLWRYNLTPTQWRWLRRVALWGGRRVLWARLYVHSDHSQLYSAGMNEGELHLRVARPASRSAHATDVFAAVRRAVSREGFWVPPVPPLLQRSNSHYAGSMAYGSADHGASVSGEVLPGVYVTDGSVAPDSPAVNPTFTLMANAYRTASAVLEELS